MPTVCSVCGEQGEDRDIVKCTACNQSYDSKCAGFKNTEQLVKLGAKKGSWQCDTCKKPKEDIRTVLAELRSLRSKVDSMKSDFSGFKESITAFSGIVDEFQKTVGELRGTVKSLKDENKNLKQEITTLKEEYSGLDERLLGLEQRSRMNNIEIAGVPETNGEACEDIVADLARAVGLDPREGDIQVAHRVNTFAGRTPRPIVCQLGDRLTAGRWMRTFRANKKLSARNINPAFRDQRVYVSEQLVPRTKKLLMDTKRKASELGYMFAWCRDGRVLVRRSENDRAVHIRGPADLARLTPAAAAAPGGAAR